MDVTALEHVVEIYRQRTGRFPASFGDKSTTSSLDFGTRLAGRRGLEAFTALPRHAHGRAGPRIPL